MRTLRHVMNRPEQQIHKAIISHLKQRGVPGLVYFHPANGGKRRKVEAAIMQSLGVRKGVSDLILLRNGHAYALELKADGGRPTVDQMEFMSDWIHAGGFGCIVKGLDRAIRVLETWGLLRGVQA